VSPRAPRGGSAGPRGSETVAVALLLALAACGGGGAPTGPDGVSAPGSPNEVRIAEFTRCHADLKGVDVSVLFTERPRRYECPEGGVPDETGLCPALGWSDLEERAVTWWRPWVRGEWQPLEPHSLEMAAAHEACHVALHTTDEAVANFCAALAYREGGCR